MNARDRDGNMTNDVKVMADAISVNYRRRLRNYQATGGCAIDANYQRDRV